MSGKQTGMARAASGVPPEWKKLAEATALEVGAKGPFTGNDVWDAGLPDPERGSRRALGSVLQHMARRNLIEPTGRFIKASNLKQHEQPIREWRLVLTRPQQEWRLVA